jgi:hypothetical protein
VRNIVQEIEWIFAIWQEHSLAAFGGLLKQFQKCSVLCHIELTLSAGNAEDFSNHMNCARHNCNESVILLDMDGHTWQIP